MTKGSLVRYLGYQVGINLPPEGHTQPLLLSLRKKLIFWSSKNLSFGGRLVVILYIYVVKVAKVG